MPSYDAPWRSNAIQLLGVLVKIQLTYPNSRNIWLSDVPIIDATLASAWGASNTANDKKASIGVSSAILTTEIDQSMVSGGEVSVVVRDVAYSHDTNPNPSDLYAYGTLGEVFTKYAAAGAAVSIYQYAKSAETLGLLESRTVSSLPVPIITGFVSAVTDFTPTTFTIRISLDYAQTMGVCPAWTVGGDGPGTRVWPYDQPGEKSGSKGLALPIRLGPPDWIPEGMESTFIHYHRRSMNGIWKNPAILPLRMTCDWNQKVASTEWYWGAQENPGGLFSYSKDDLFSGGLPPHLYSTVPGLSNLGVMVNNADVNVAATETTSIVNGFYQFKTPRFRQITARLIPTEVSTSTAVGNPQNLIDRRPDTYMKLTGTEWVKFRIPKCNPGGTVSATWGAIRVYCMFIKQPPGEVAATGSFKIGIAAPTTGTWLQGVTPSDQTTPATSPKSYTINAIGTPPTTNHWRGTRFERFDFTVSGTTDVNDADSTLYIAGQQGEPYCLQFLGNAGCIVYLSALWLDVQYVSGLDNFVPYMAQWRRFKGGFKTYHFLEGYVPSELPRRVLPGNRHLWNRIVGGARSRGEPRDKPDPIDPEGAYVWHPGFWDNGDAYGGGEGWIQSPGAMCNYLATNYTRPQQSLTKGTMYQPQDVNNFGSVKYFDDIMRAWSSLHQSYTGGYRMYWWRHEQNGTDDAIASILSELPGSPAIVPRYDGTPGLVAMDVDMGSQYQHPCNWEDGISFRDVVTSANGIPNFEVTLTPVSDIINDIEVHYQFDPHSRTYGAIAKANSRKQDDGSTPSGNNPVGWPLTPGTGKSATQLCTDSMAAFTSGKALKAVFKLNYIWDPAVAIAFGCWKLWRNWRPYAIVRFIGTMACQDMLPGMVISFNNDVYTIGGIICPIPFTHPGAGLHGSWANRYWHVIGNRRIDSGKTVQYEVTAIEHLNNSVGLAALSGGPPTVPAEGFDQ